MQIGFVNYDLYLVQTSNFNDKINAIKKEQQHKQEHRNSNNKKVNNGNTSVVGLKPDLLI